MNRSVFVMSRLLLYINLQNGKYTPLNSEDGQLSQVDSCLSETELSRDSLAQQWQVRMIANQDVFVSMCRQEDQRNIWSACMHHPPGAWTNSLDSSPPAHPLDHTSLESASQLESCSATDLDMLSPAKRQSRSAETKVAISKLTTKQDVTHASHSVWWMSSKSQRPTRTSVSFTISRDASSQYVLITLKPTSSFAKSRQRSSERTKSHTLWPTTEEPSDTHTQTSRRTTLLR